MEESTEEAAGRLHQFLAFCQTHATGQVRVHEVWSAYFGVDPQSSDYSQLMAGVALLPRQLERQIMGMPDSPLFPKRHLCEQIPDLQRLLSWGVLNQHEWSATFANQYDNGMLARLDMTGAMLKGYSKEVLPDGALSAIAELAEQISILVSETTDMPTGLRELLFELSEGLRRAVLAFKITGSEGIARERDLLIGRLRSNAAIVSELRKNAKATKLVQKVFVATTAALTFFHLGVTATADVPDLMNNLKEIEQLVHPSPEDAQEAQDAEAATE